MVDKEAVLETVSDSLDVAEEVAQEVITVVRTNKLALAGFALGGIVIGAGLAHVLTKNHARAHYQAIADEQVKEVKEFYLGTIAKSQPTATDAMHELVGEEGYDTTDGGLDTDGREGWTNPGEAIGKVELTEDNQGVEAKVTLTPEAAEKLKPKTDYTKAATEAPEPPGEAKAEKPVVDRKNVFHDAASANSTFDYDIEMKLRSGEEIHVISEEEFNANETDYEQSQATYYLGDDTLVDESETPIPNPESLVGDLANIRWGYGATDRNMAFIRNNRVEVDFELFKRDGTYTMEVLGLDEPVIKHSAGPTRFRLKDDD